MRPSPLHPPADERGFILVGVVTFMLALTILGLSLFALSSYEAQFFVASAAREQSLQNSESGMELVKALLAAPGSQAQLEYAHRAEGQMGVTRAMAYQQRSADPNDTTSTGPVNWDSTLVIVVAARSGGVERTLQARYIPSATEDPYQRLLAAGLGVSVNTKNSASPSVLQLSGHVWHPVASDADTSWTDDVDWPTGRPIERGTPPTPLADVFVQGHLPAQDPSSASGTNLADHTEYEIDFVGSKLFTTFFQSPPSPTNAGETGDPQHNAYSFYIGDKLDLLVQGVAVWVVGSATAGGLQGVCFKNRVRVRPIDPSVPSTLVIVAMANQRDPGYENRAIWFRGGLDVSGVQVYLVSQGDVSIVHDNNADKSNSAGTVSIVAGGHVEIGGPDSGQTFQLGYDPTTMDALADELLGLGALPQLMGGTGANFVVARQTWLETTPR